MMRCKKLLSVVALALPLAVGAGLLSLAPSSADAFTEAPELCFATGIGYEGMSGTYGCVYGPPTSPLLVAEVCYDNGVSRLKGTSPCVGKERTYTVKYGEVVNPLTGEIVAYAPVADACTIANVVCLPSDINTAGLADGVACCNPDTGECTQPDANGNCTVGDITWCKELEDNGNGSVTCHE
jgi:hypothetical protein